VESPSLEVFKKTCRHGTSGHGLAGMVVLGWRLDFMILRCLFQPYWFYEKRDVVNVDTQHLEITVT